MSYMLDSYLLYLGFITKKIQKFFDEQREFICCQKGCAKCCKKAQFPYTKIEFDLIFKGFLALEHDKKLIVLDKVDKIIANKQHHDEQTPNEKFRYDCPFLINNECSVYYYRGLICRSFGLMSFKPNSEKVPLIPFCAYEGLNYSKVLDKNTNKISEEKYNEQVFINEPKAYNIDYSTLIKEDIAKGFGFEFGEAKPLIEWFIKRKENQIILIEDME